ncbi:MAG: FecR domain-containing protein [Deltaproteobacteria bacterium]|nr:FecR domain-containing protein [Deltaproteobacteria bacterium]
MRISPLVRSLVLPACLLPAVALATEQAGVSAAVRGSVTLARAQAGGRAVVSGEDIFLQDWIESGDRSGMQILLLDETAFTIGPDSAIAIDEFVYDPATSAGRLAARVSKGVFRFVSGKIAKQPSDNVNVALPSGNVGIRGTMVAGAANPTTRASLVVLLGEGPDNAAGEPAGSIDVCNAGACTHVERPGFGVRIDGVESPPSPAFRVSDVALSAILGSVSGSDSPPSTDEADAAVDPGLAAREDARTDHREAAEQRRRLARLDVLDSATDLAAQDATFDDDEKRLHGWVKAPNGPTSFDQLRSISQGQIHYAQSGVPLTGGSYDFSVDVDLGAQTIGGGHSMFQVNGSRTGVEYFSTPVSYGSLQGPAQFYFYSSSISGSGCGSYCTARLALFPQNAAGYAAIEALHGMTIKDFGGSVIDQGAGKTTAHPGPTP